MSYYLKIIGDSPRVPPAGVMRRYEHIYCINMQVPSGGHCVELSWNVVTNLISLNRAPAEGLYIKDVC